MLPSRPTLLKSQIFFAYISGGVGAFLALLTLPALPISEIIPLSFLGYAILCPLLCQHWRRSIDKGSMARGEHIASITFWAIPFLASLAATAILLVEELRKGPMIFNDVSFHPIQFIGFPIVGALWFGAPLICSILIARIDSASATLQPAPALR